MEKTTQTLPAVKKSSIPAHSEICWRADQSLERRKKWEPILRECYEMASPWNNPYDGDQARDKDSPLPMNNLFDSTMLTSNFRATNRLFLDLVPPDQNWIDIKPGPVLEMRYGKGDIEQLNQELDKIKKILAMPFKSESFGNSMWQVINDSRTAGLGVMLSLDKTEDDLNPVSFECVSQAEVTIERDTDGEEKGIYRTRKIRAKEIKSKWSDAKISTSLTDKIAADKNKNPEVKLSEATFYHEGKWIYRVYYRANKSDPEILVDRSYNTNPWTLFPWSIIPGCEYGPGPVMMMLPDGRTANKVMEFLLTNAALALAGMFMVRDDGVVNPDNIQIVAGGFIPVASTGGNLGASIVPLSTNRNFDLGQVILNDLRNSIKKGLQDNGLPDPAGPVRSPTEIIERMRELTQDNGGAAIRLNAGLAKLVRRVADIMGSRGFIPKLSIDNFALKIQINSPLARTQQFQEVETLVKWIEMCKMIGGDQLTMLVAKLEQILVWIADQIGVPSQLINNEKERTVMKEQQAKVMQAQMAAQAMGQMTKQAA